MNPFIKTAVSLGFFGVCAAIVCLLKTTPITMMFFFFLGLPAFLGCIVAYLLYLMSLAGIRFSPRGQG